MSASGPIRDALAREDFAAAARLFEDFAHSTHDAASLAEARTLLALALAVRAHLQDRLDAIRSRGYVARAYTCFTPRE
jgi:hypothetical protein